MLCQIQALKIIPAIELKVIYSDLLSVHLFFLHHAFLFIYKHFSHRIIRKG